MDLMLRIFKALANETRIRALKLLLEEGEVVSEEISARLRVPPATACRNLKILERAGLVRSRIKAGRAFYAIDDSPGFEYNPLIWDILRRRMEYEEKQGD